MIALVVPNRLSIEALAKDLSLHRLLTYSELCSDPDVIETVFKAIVETGLENKLNRKELPLKMSLCKEEWTPDNGLLTAALKLKRYSIHAKYKPTIDRMCGST